MNKSQDYLLLLLHQLKTPLTGNKWFLELMLDKDYSVLTAKQKEIINDLAFNNDLMMTLVKDMLTLVNFEKNQGTKLHLEEVDLREVIKAEVTKVTLMLKKKELRINYIGFDKPAILKIDRLKIGLAIQNVINNAIKYSKEDTEIRIEIKQAKDSITLEIQDSGIGIPKSEAPNIFGKFYRSSNAIKNETEGSGLGLYLTRKIVLMHKGDIWFESRENFGTIFYIKFNLK